MKKEMVNHPDHYKEGGLEVIDVINAFEHVRRSFNLGNAIKYILRAGKKGKLIQDLEKAMWYLKEEIRYTKENNISVEYIPGKMDVADVVKAFYVVRTQEQMAIAVACILTAGMKDGYVESLSCALNALLAERSELYRNPLKTNPDGTVVVTDR